MLHAAVHGYECVVDKAGGAGRVTAYERPKMKRLVAEAKQVQCGSKPAGWVAEKVPVRSSGGPRGWNRGSK